MMLSGVPLLEPKSKPAKSLLESSGQQTSGRCYFGTMAARQVRGLGCNSRRHIRCVIYWQYRQFSWNALQPWKQTNTSIYKTITYSCHSHAKLWAHGAKQCQHWISWKFVRKNHFGDWWHKWKISLVSENSNAACVQCCFCNENVPLEWPLTTNDNFRATIYNDMVHRGLRKIITIHSW